MEPLLHIFFGSPRLLAQAPKWQTERHPELDQNWLDASDELSLRDVSLVDQLRYYLVENKLKLN